MDVTTPNSQPIPAQVPVVIPTPAGQPVLIAPQQPPLDSNGFSPRQKAYAGLTIIGALLAFSIGAARWAEHQLTSLIDNANQQAAIERKRSDDREEKSRAHGERAIELIGAKIDAQAEKSTAAMRDHTDRVEKALHTQTMMADRWQQKMIELQKELSKKVDQRASGE